MRPIFEDFSTQPPTCANSSARTPGPWTAGDHLKLGAGGSVEVTFHVHPDDDLFEATLHVKALASKNGAAPGHAPMDVLVNGRKLVAGLTIPGGGDLPQDNVVAVSRDLLRVGANTVQVRSSAEAKTMLWVYSLTIDPVNARGRSSRDR